MHCSPLCRDADMRAWASAAQDRQQKDMAGWAMDCQKNETTNCDCKAVTQPTGVC
jgi:hypothetical protein